MANPSPGARAHPEHTISLECEGQHIVIRFDGRIVADSRTAITLREAGYPAVLYVPLSDVDQSLLQPSDHHTRCPFKGEARYWSLVTPDARADNAVWAYDAPYDEVADIAGHVAFYPQAVAISVE